MDGSSPREGAADMEADTQQIPTQGRKSPKSVCIGPVLSVRHWRPQTKEQGHEKNRCHFLSATIDPNKKATQEISPVPLGCSALQPEGQQLAAMMYS